MAMSRVGAIKILGIAVLLATMPLFCGHLSAQSTRWEVSLNGGFMTPNNFNMIEYSAWTVGGDVAWWYRCEGDSWWEWRRKYPQFGVKASFAYIPQSISGHRIGLVGLLRAPLTGALDYHIGVGFSMYTRSQYFTKDPDNIFISTLLSCLIDVGFDYRIGNGITASFSFLHSSNGLLHRPNKGLNYLQVGFGYAFGGDWKRMEERDVKRPSFNRTELNIAFQGGMATSRDLWVEGLRPCYDLSLNYQYYIDPVVALGGTLDFWYNGTHTDLIRVYGYDYPIPCYVSTLAYAEGFWGSVSIKGGMGFTILASPCVYVSLYERVGVYYNFSNNYVGVALNAHAGMIEFIELCYGIRIKGD